MAKVIVAYWIDESGYPRSIERISTTAADMKKFLQSRHSESRIKWFDHPACAAKDYPTRDQDHWWKDGFEYLQYLLDNDRLGIVGARIAYYDAENDYTGHVYKYGFQVRNLH